MSKISQELKVLLYLHQRYVRTRFVSIKEIADYLEVSDRQARRYIEDLSMIPEIDIETKLGRRGGYRLVTPLDEGFAMPENIVLAMSIAMKRNQHVEEVLASIPNYVVTDHVDGDNFIDNNVLNNLEIIFRAIEEHTELTIAYEGIPSSPLVQPYRVLFTNHTYYLYAVHRYEYATSRNEIKKYDVSKMTRIWKRGSFVPKKEVMEEILDRMTRYGIKDGTATVLRVKCKDKDALRTFNKYFEGKGKMDLENLTFEVTGNSENELFYPLFRIGTKSYQFIDEDFKNKYVEYLENQIRSIKNHDQ